MTVNYCENYRYCASYYYATLFPEIPVSVLRMVDVLHDAPLQLRVLGPTALGSGAFNFRVWGT